MSRITVTIPQSKFIPTIGKGPINKPIKITKAQYDMLVKIGFNVQVVELKPSKIVKLEEAEGVAPVNSLEEPAKDVDPEQVDSEDIDVDPEQVDSEDIDVDLEQVDSEEGSLESSDEVEQVDSEDTDVEALINEMKVDELKELLEKSDIEFKYNSRSKELKELALKNKDKLVF